MAGSERTSLWPILAAGWWAFALLPGLSAMADDEPVRKDPAQTTEMPSSLRGLQALEARVVEVAGKVLPAVIGVNNSAGVIVSQDGLALTAAHLGGLRGAKVTVRLSSACAALRTRRWSGSRAKGLSRAQGWASRRR